ncbi:MAG: hypothetical protein FJ398_04665 [Verrucomicrobia bacterium]|nr:hypothetical protein [Verrucomicrobiota bacterium]
MLAEAMSNGPVVCQRSSAPLDPCNSAAAWSSRGFSAGLAPLHRVRSRITDVRTSHEPDGRASLSPASRVGRVPRTSSGSPGRTRPTGFMDRMHGAVAKSACHKR